jgi:hypothetical protein
MVMMDHAGGAQTSFREFQLATKSLPAFHSPCSLTGSVLGPVTPESLAEVDRNYKILYWPEHSTPFLQECFYIMLLRFKDGVQSCGV